MRITRAAALAALASAVSLLWTVPAEAADITATDAAVMAVDDREFSRVLYVEAPAGEVIETVTVKVELGKTSDALDSDGTCDPFTPGSGYPSFQELEVTLFAPSGQHVRLTRPYAPGDEGSGRRFTMTFADGAPAQPEIPTTGTFAPHDSLSALTGSSPSGIWALSLWDARSGDPLCYYGAELRIVTGTVPVAGDSTVATSADTATPVVLPASDADGDALTYTVDAVGGIGGAVECDPEDSASCTYAPPAGTTGRATIDFTVSDGIFTDTGRVTVDVREPALATLTLTPSSTTVDEGGTVELTATGTTASGDDLGDVTDEVTFSSDVPTDVVDGNRITFPTASPHTITATHGPTGVSSSVVIEVVPAAVPPATPAPPRTGQLPDAGGPGAAWPVAGALAVLVGGTLLLGRRLRA